MGSVEAHLPFVAEPPGDLGAVTRLAVVAARHWDLPTPQLARVGMNALFVAGDDVMIRIGRPTTDPYGALRLAVVLSDHGVAVAPFVRDDVVADGPLVAWAMQRLHACQKIDWSAVGATVARVHAIPAAALAEFYPVPLCTSLPWWHFESLLAEVEDLLDPTARHGLGEAIERRRGWDASSTDTWVLCHGDVHPGNVLAAADGPVLLDWDLVCVGPRGWDHGPLMTWTARWGGAAGVYDEFVTGYGSSLRGDPAAEALAELRLVAATLMRLRAGRTDPGAAAEAERRLRYWRHDPDAPPWRAA